MSKTIPSPYRYDFVGSFLRPENLKQARKDYNDGIISKEQLTAVEDEEIKKQQAIILLQTESLDASSGISILCGDLKGLDIREPLQVCNLTAKLHSWKILT